MSGSTNLGLCSHHIFLHQARKVTCGEERSRVWSESRRSARQQRHQQQPQRQPQPPAPECRSELQDEGLLVRAKIHPRVFFYFVQGLQLCVKRCDPCKAGVILANGRENFVFSYCRVEESRPHLSRVQTVASHFLGHVVEETQKSAYVRRVPQGQDQPLPAATVAAKHGKWVDDNVTVRSKTLFGRFWATF